FAFNQRSPIKALGKKYFILKDDQISIQSIDSSVILQQFKLPQQLITQQFSDDCLPNYQLPAV
ncbi:MAG: hypothetical protein U9N30_01590, partial [Campylobacterota bacterium]|nr:hypothetical protein [Campylobacterota bacterium]